MLVLVYMQITQLSSRVSKTFEFRFFHNAFIFGIPDGLAEVITPSNADYKTHIERHCTQCSPSLATARRQIGTKVVTSGNFGKDEVTLARLDYMSVPRRRMPHDSRLHQVLAQPARLQHLLGGVHAVV